MAGEHHIILQEKEKAMAFKTIMTTIKDSFSLCEPVPVHVFCAYLPNIAITESPDIA